ncbi:MAG: hypothetical protein M1830_006421 [Pleopsidium flavum]|nr:MAG: hypothetical protein M1830_006421 [Pleopsidium flavum]
MAGRAVTQRLGKLIEANVKVVNMTGNDLIDGMRQHHTPMTDYGVHMVRRLLESGLGPSEITWSQVLLTAGAMVANQAQVFTQTLDYYLSEEGMVHLPEINRLAKLNTPEADDKILHYSMEGILLSGTFGSYREATMSTTVDDGGRQIAVKPGDKVFVSFVGAARDPDIFPLPDTVRRDRPLESYIHYGEGPHACLGKEASRMSITAMMKVVGASGQPEEHLVPKAS